MKHLAVIAVALVGACATGADPAATYDHYRSAIRISTNAQGWQVASTAPTAEQKDANLYSGGESLAMWVMVLKREGSPTLVTLAGSRARAIQQGNVQPTEEQGPWDRPEPAHVGNPWREADFAFTERKTECYGENFWCNRLQQFSVLLPPDAVKAFIAEGAADTIPVALFTRRDVDWRIPRVELLAALDAAGVTAEFR